MTGPLKPITWGKDHNFFKELTISSTVFGGDTYPDGYSVTDGYDANAFIWFSTAGTILSNKEANNVTTKVIEFSFNGNTVHGELDPADTSTRSLIFYNRIITKIWFRVKSGSSGSIKVQIHSWALS